jgi:pseudouridylate synthase / pseudouridine kinase
LVVNDNARLTMMMIVQPEILDALKTGRRPVVALESTIIAHGMPYPQNLETALALERALRANGAIPATIAVIAGVVRVGLTSDDLRLLADPNAQQGRNVRKLARRDIASCVASGAHGATTVSATMHVAAAAGIRVLATGGIGGVHRGVANSWDISADIPALAQLPMLVVCAGIKTILDIPKTLEALETASVPVVTLNPDQGEFPGFYTRKSGAKTPDAVDNEFDAARMFCAHAATATTTTKNLMSSSGMLLAVPVPREYEADPSVIAHAIQAASQEATEKGVVGSQATPFLLAQIAKLTNNTSLFSNIELVKNNAAVAARIAAHVSMLSTNSCISYNSTSTRAATRKPVVVVAGGVALDITAEPKAALIRNTSNPGSVRHTVGGVGRNIAQTIHNHGLDVLLLSAVGDDIPGATIVAAFKASGFPSTGLDIVAGGQTATYCSVQDHHGDLDVAISSMGLFESRLANIVNYGNLKEALVDARMVCVDANICLSDIEALVRLADEHQLPVWFEPVSVAKSTNVLSSAGCGRVLDQICYLSPNEDELLAISRHLMKGTVSQVANVGLPAVDSLEQEIDRAASRILNAHNGDRLCIVCTRGSKGVSLYIKQRKYDRACFNIFRIPAAPVPGGRVVSVSGAGDVLAGTMIAHIVKYGDGSVVAAARQGVAAAAASCSVSETVPPQLAKL